MVHDVTAEADLGPRERKRRRTIEQIVAEALRLLTEEGFEALTVHRLAKELGYAVGALYRYFPSKDALVAAVQRRVLERIHDDVREALAATEARLERAGDADEAEQALTRILVVARVYESLAVRRPAPFRLLSLSLGDPRELLPTDTATEVLGTLAGLNADVSELLRAAERTEALSPGDADRRAVVLWASLQGVMQLRKLARFEMPALEPTALSAETLHTLLAGWGADPELTRSADRRAARIVEQTQTREDD